jgi:hypothetical protein
MPVLTFNPGRRIRALVGTAPRENRATARLSNDRSASADSGITNPAPSL